MVRSAPQPHHEAPADRGSSGQYQAAKPRRRIKVTFGGVTVLVQKPTVDEIKRNIAASDEALKRLKRFRPGIRLNAKKDVPLYSADPDRPGVYVRLLNGVTDRGVLENGAFKVID